MNLWSMHRMTGGKGRSPETELMWVYSRISLHGLLPCIENCEETMDQVQDLGSTGSWQQFSFQTSLAHGQIKRGMNMLEESSYFTPWQPYLDYGPLLWTGNVKSSMQHYFSSHRLSKTLRVLFHGTVSIYHEYLQDLHLWQALTFSSSLCSSCHYPHIKRWGRRGQL